MWVHIDVRIGSWAHLGAVSTQAAYYTLLATDGSLVHTDWNRTQPADWNTSERTHVPVCPLPPEHMRWPTPREQEAELVRRRAKWAREHPKGFPAQCRKSNAPISANVLIVVCGVLVLFVVVVNWFLIRRFFTVSLGLLPRLPRLRRVRKGQWSLGPQAAQARDWLLLTPHPPPSPSPPIVISTHPPPPPSSSSSPSSSP